MALNLTLPIPGTTSGIDAANELVTALEKVEVYFDTHDHTGGNGGLITPTAMSINADLPFNDNKLTTLKTCGFTSQASSPSVGTSLFVLNDDLWYNNGIIDIQLTTASGAFVTVNGLTDSYNNSSPSLGKLGYDAGTGTYFCSVGDTGSALTSQLATLKAESVQSNLFTDTGTGLLIEPQGVGSITMRCISGSLGIENVFGGTTISTFDGNINLIAGDQNLSGDGNIIIKHSGRVDKFVSIGADSQWSATNLQGALFVDGAGVTGGVGSPNGARLGFYAVQAANPPSGPNITHIKTEGDSHLSIHSTSDANFVSLGDNLTPGPIIIAGSEGTFAAALAAVVIHHRYDEFVLVKGTGDNGGGLDARGSLRIENSGNVEAICKSNLTSHPSDFTPVGYGSTIAPVLEIGSTGDIYLGAGTGTTYVDKGTILNTGPIISVDTETNPFAITNNPATMNAQNAIVARASFVVVPTTSVTPSVNNWNVASGHWVSAGVYDIILNTAPTNNDFSIVVTANEAAPYFGSAVWNSAIPKLEVYFWDSSGVAADVTDFSIVAVGL
jgi:hypothetical protein